jgi:hypothetical protein
MKEATPTARQISRAIIAVLEEIQDEQRALADHVMNELLLSEDRAKSGAEKKEKAETEEEFKSHGGGVLILLYISVCPFLLLLLILYNSPCLLLYHSVCS